MKTEDLIKERYKPSQEELDWLKNMSHDLGRIMRGKDSQPVYATTIPSEMVIPFVSIVNLGIDTYLTAWRRLKQMGMVGPGKDGPNDEEVSQGIGEIIILCETLSENESMDAPMSMGIGAAWFVWTTLAAGISAHEWAEKESE